MNRMDEQLQRLFRAARGAADDFIAPSVPYGLKTRVVAAWREGQVVEFWDASLLRRALICAGIAMVLSFWPILTQSQSTNPFAESLQLADTDTQVDFAP